MPGLRGLGVIEQMRHERPHVPALLMSGNAAAHELAASVQVPFLKKPFGAAALYAAVEALLSPDRASSAKLEGAGGQATMTLCGSLHRPHKDPGFAESPLTYTLAPGAPMTVVLIATYIPACGHCATLLCGDAPSRVRHAVAKA